MKRLVRKGVIASPMAVQWGSTTRGCDYLFTGGRSKQDAITLVSHMAPGFVTQIEAIAQQIDEPVEVELPVAKAVLPPLLVGGMSMTSLDIAELVRSQHANVKISIERLMDRGVIQGIALQELSTPSGQTAKAYVFTGEQGKRDSIVVVAQISPEFTARLVDRWQELEAQVAKPAFAVPTSFAEALRLAGELEEQRVALTHQVGVQAEKIAKDKPKVEYHDAVKASEQSQTMLQVANKYGIGRTKLFRFLRENGILRDAECSPPYQRFIDSGHFEVDPRFFKRDGKFVHYTQTKVTGKGDIYIGKLLRKAGLINSGE
ncbi:phage antirepressor KilAC domain-containing protein [Pseudomonas guariconensis]|uniref:phage antirepressor KilAC domain-containing protein n=1 Tax=Pseudomonas guariconensis TaxID=1288410 RepID=UPI002FE6AB2E